MKNNQGPATHRAMNHSIDSTNNEVNVSRRGFVGSSLAVAGLLGGSLAAGSASAGAVVNPTRGIISISSFGAVGDGIADDTVAIQAALDSLVTGVALTLDGLTFKISGQLEISLKSGFVIDGIGATIIAEDGMPSIQGNNLLFIHECTDFTVRNLTVDGNRSTRTSGGQIWACNIAIHSCMRFIFEQVTSNNAVVDGFLFTLMDPLNYNDSSTYNRDFIMLNCFADNCYRQGASVINAYDFAFFGGAYTNTNGTAPQAGIDVESNGGPTLGNARGRFYGCRFEGNAGYGLVLSGKAGAKSYAVENCNFSTNENGGLLVAADQTHIKGCEFGYHSGPGITQGIVSFQANSAIVSGSISDCSFVDNGTTKYAIYLHSLTSGIRVTNNKIANHTGHGIFMYGSRHIVAMNSITNCGGLGIAASCLDGRISDNQIRETTGYGIYGDIGARLRVMGNEVKDILSATNAYIKCTDVDCEIYGNTCISSYPTSTYGIWIDTNALAVHGNICINLNSTDPYFFKSPGSNDELFYNNIGGTANDRRSVRKGMAAPSFSNSLRPNASSVAIGQCIFNTTTGRPNWSNGVNWVDSAGTVV